MTDDWSVFTQSTLVPCSIPVAGISSSGAMRATFVGSGVVRCNGLSLTLTRMYYVPGLNRTLLSVSALVDDDYEFHIRKVEAVNIMQVMRYGITCLTVPAGTGLYQFASGPSASSDSSDVSACALVGHLRGGTYSGAIDPADLLHQRFGHVSLWSTNFLAELKRSYPSVDFSALAPCDPCLRSKLRKSHSIDVPRRPARSPLDRVHFDISPCVGAPALGGAIGFLLAVDEFTGMLFVYPILRKSDVSGLLAQFTLDAETHFNGEHKVGIYTTCFRLRSLRSDNAGENTSFAIRDWCASIGARHEFSAAYHQHANGVVERAMQTVWQGSEATRKGAGAPVHYWWHSLSHFVQVRNLLPSRSRGDRSPWELWWGIVVPLAKRISHLRVFGSLCWRFVPKPLRGKFDDRGRPSIFIGLSTTTKGYNVLDLETGRVYCSPSVAFDETERPFITLAHIPAFEPLPAWPAAPAFADLPPEAVPSTIRGDSSSSPTGQLDTSPTGSLCDSGPPDAVSDFSPPPLAGDVASSVSLDSDSAASLSRSVPASASRSRAVPRLANRASVRFRDVPDVRRAGAVSGARASSVRAAGSPSGDFVDAIAGHRIARRLDDDNVASSFVTEEYKCHWHGYPRTVHTWLEAHDFVASPDSDDDLLTTYQRKHSVKLHAQRRRFPGQVLGFDYCLAPPSLEPPVLASDGPVLAPVGPLDVQPVAVTPSSAVVPPSPPAPDETTIAALRATLLLQQDKPVPVSVFDDAPFSAISATSSLAHRLDCALDRPHLSAQSLSRIRRRIDLIALAATAPVVDHCPKDIAAVAHDVNADDWYSACDTELGSCADFGTWVLVQPPPGATILTCRWVFTVKRDKLRAFRKLKARLVVRGFSQIPGVDFGDTYAPTCRLRTFRALVAEASGNSAITINTWDCTNAFLHSYTDRDLYMTQPPGFNTGDGRVCKLIRNLYGLKQSPRLFSQLVRETLLTFGTGDVSCVVARADECLFIIRSGASCIKVLVHVDDFCVQSNDPIMYAALFAHMRKWLRVNDDGLLSLYLGVSVSRRADFTYDLSQTAYIDTLIDRLGLSWHDGAASPMKGGVSGKLTPLDRDLTVAEQRFMDSVPYREAVGGLFYLSRCTRSDISYAANQVARFMANPAPFHWQAVLRIYAFLKRTRAVPLHFPSAEVAGTELAGFSDSDWRGCLETRKSHTGWLVYRGRALVAWHSARQTTLAQSSAEAEFTAAVSLAQELCWWRLLSLDLGAPCLSATTIWCDSSSAVSLSKHGGNFAHTKYWSWRQWVLQEYYALGVVVVDWLPTVRQRADCLTKNLFPSAFLPAASVMLGSDLVLAYPRH